MRKMTPEEHEKSILNSHYKIVKHFKRELKDPSSFESLYVIHGIATHSETKEKLVIYSDGVEGNWYARPYDMFMSEVDHEKYPDIKQQYRFERLTLHEIQKLNRTAFRKWIDEKSKGAGDIYLKTSIKD